MKSPNPNCWKCYGSGEYNVPTQRPLRYPIGEIPPAPSELAFEQVRLTCDVCYVVPDEPSNREIKIIPTKQEIERGRWLLKLLRHILGGRN